MSIKNDLIIITSILGIVIVMIGSIEARADENAINYNTKTNGISDWLKRQDGTYCMNYKSPATIDQQKTYQDMKDHGIEDFKLNPWPLLCSTPEDQGNDYMNKVANGEDPTPQVIIPPSENTTK